MARFELATRGEVTVYDTTEKLLRETLSDRVIVSARKADEVTVTLTTQI